MDRVLIVDDDVELTELVGEYLRSEGFEVEAVHDGQTGLQRAQSGQHALVVLDIMLPKMNGLDVLRALRPKSRVPVLILTARGDDMDRIIGLEIGADDYLGKPFNVRELVARIRAILRRATAAPATGREPLDVGDVHLDPGARTVRRDGQPVDLTSVEFEILELLLRNAGQVVTRDQIANDVLGRQLFAYDRSVDVHVSKVRRKLGPGADGDDRIKTVRGEGYVYAVAADQAD
jgi:two-component system, OmpR family, response regulator CpxR